MHDKADLKSASKRPSRRSGKEANVHPLAAPPGLEASVAIGDWDDLLSAVKDRIRSTVAQWAAATPAAQLTDSAQGAQSALLDCVAVLDQLHANLMHDLGRSQQLEREVSDAQVSLTQARAELVGTRATEERAHYLALHDSLTLLPNRAFFDQQLERALALPALRRPPLAVMYLDLDGFKPINDAHGHAAGDEMLRIVAARLTRAVRAEDLVSRQGGDEFACLLLGLSNPELLGQLANKLHTAVAAPCKIGALRLSVKASIGIAMCPADGDGAQLLLGHADAAMFRAKREQTRYAFFNQEIDG